MGYIRGIAVIPAALSACAWAPVVHRFPSGLTVVRGDHVLVAQACSERGSVSGRRRYALAKTDKGETLDPRRIVGCYSQADDTIYLRNTNEGAKALLHELAHRDGVKDPAKAGYDW